jgi:hypothetical protein
VSSPVRRNALRRAGARIDVPVAVAAWLCGWLLASVAAVIVLGAAGYEDTDDAAIWALFVAQLLGWGALVGAMVVASRRDGSGDFGRDYAVRFRPVDVVGAVAGVLTQLVVLPLVYLPMERLWPDTFDDDRLSENARDLADRAQDGALVLLVVMVCIGAPLVEELVYRGLLQGAFANRVSQVPAWLAASAWFAIIHFRPIEYPGLFVAGLVFGACVLLTGRLGPAVMAHLGFNVAGLVIAFD